MQVCLVGADFEENLALGILAAVVAEAGHRPWVAAFNGASDTDALVRQIVERAPEVVGLSVQFQHRADEFFSLARALRGAGYRGHITVGGHFPSLAYRETLERGNAVDSVVLYDGEETLAALLAALDAQAPLAEVAGLALLDGEGHAVRTAPRPLIAELDRVPHPLRYRPHAQHLGVPFIPIMGARGCWGRCSFCSISAMYRDGRKHGGGSLLRMRSAEDVAAEIAALWHRAGGRGIFCFHDDNFLLPRPADSLARLRAIRAALDDFGVGKLALVGKCRPETLTVELARQLASLGVIRLYVGVENTTEAGAAHLGRQVQQRAVRTALEACRQAGIFVCYNLLIFEPDATVADVRANVRFMREHADHPVNFCRAEPYFGTPLQQDIAARQALSGDYLGWTYRLEDDRAELLYRICAAAFAERNFDPAGVANRYMSLGYSAKVLAHFYGERREVTPLVRRARKLTRAISLDTAELFERAIALGESVSLDDRDTIARRTALLGLEVAATDRVWHRQLDQVLGEIDALALSEPVPPPALPPRRKPLPHKCSLAVGMSMAVAWSALAPSGCSEGEVVDPAVGGMGGTTVVDPPPGGMGGTVVDPAVGGMGGSGGASGGAGGAGGSGFGGNLDPAPGGMGGTAAYRTPDHRDTALASAAEPSLPAAALVDGWRDSAAQRVRRTRDLPLHDPPRLTLSAARRDGAIAVRIEGEAPALSTRFEADGSVAGKGRQCLWRPDRPDERLRVAMRTPGGVAILSLRADEVDG